jgi:hypothetical protein
MAAAIITGLLRNTTAIKAHSFSPVGTYRASL